MTNLTNLLKFLIFLRGKMDHKGKYYYIFNTQKPIEKALKYKLMELYNIYIIGVAFFGNNFYLIQLTNKYITPTETCKNLHYLKL